MKESFLRAQGSPCQIMNSKQIDHPRSSPLLSTDAPLRCIGNCRSSLPHPRMPANTPEQHNAVFEPPVPFRGKSAHSHLGRPRTRTVGHSRVILSILLESVRPSVRAGHGPNGSRTKLFSGQKQIFSKLHRSTSTTCNQEIRTLVRFFSTLDFEP